MSDESKIDVRYQKLKEMQICYENSKWLGKFRKILSISLISFAWLVTFFIGFTTPFFFIHFIGTSIYLYDYINNGLSKENINGSFTSYLFDPIFGLLVIITFLCGLYTFLSVKNCAPYYK